MQKPFQDAMRRRCLCMCHTHCMSMLHLGQLFQYSIDLQPRSPKSLESVNPIWSFCFSFCPFCSCSVENEKRKSTNGICKRQAIKAQRIVEMRSIQTLASCPSLAGVIAGAGEHLFANHYKNIILLLIKC